MLQEAATAARDNCRFLATLDASLQPTLSGALSGMPVHHINVCVQFYDGGKLSTVTALRWSLHAK